MLLGDKSSFTATLKRQAAPTETGYEENSRSHKQADARAWATANTISGGAKKRGVARRRRKTN